LLTNLSFVYLSGVHLFNLSCKASFHDWRPAMSHAIDGQVALLHRAPNLIWEMSFYGFWRPWALQSAFAADSTWIEVLRIAPHWRLGEGGAFGCWFEASRGSGAAINVGRSLRAFNRSALASALGLNVTSIFASPLRGRWHVWRNVSTADWPPANYAGVALHDEAGLRQRYFDINPWRLELKVDLCRPAIRLGYDTIQLFHELCSREADRKACGVEIVSCHPACLRLRNRKDRRPCIPGLPLRTGWGLESACVCNNSFSDGRMMNCASTVTRVRTATALRSLDPPVRTQRLNNRLMRFPSCACGWCKGNRSHITRDTSA
jgi:hypothetical protein